MKFYGWLGLSVLFSVFWAFGSISEAQAACQERHDYYDNARLDIYPTGAPSLCWLSIGQKWPENLIYRSILLGQDGSIMVFNSLGSGRESTNTGAREFYLFPRSHEWSWEARPGRLRVRLTNGMVIEMDTEKVLWTSASGGEIVEDPSVNRTNNGGIEIRPSHGIVLDFGFRFGSSPSADRRRSADFVDAAGRRCRVKNTEVIKIDAGGEPLLRWDDDADIAAFIRQRCPNLQVDFPVADPLSRP